MICLNIPRHSPEPPELEPFEQELHDHLMAIERDLLAEELSRYDVTAEQVTVEGWGHSTYTDALRLAQAARVKQLVLFHHDPSRSNLELDTSVMLCNAWSAKHNVISSVRGFEVRTTV